MKFPICIPQNFKNYIKNFFIEFFKIKNVNNFFQIEPFASFFDAKTTDELIAQTSYQ
jgi:hypothetical protein